jgi:rare lipoprotein A
MLRLALAVAPAAVVIACALVFMRPLGAFACDRVTIASYYGTESGSRTATGHFFDGTQMIVASRDLPFGTKLRLSLNGNSAVATVDDRGPAAWTGRSLDVSRAVAVKLGMLRAGVARLCVERLN